MNLAPQRIRFVLASLLAMAATIASAQGMPGGGMGGVMRGGMGGGAREGSLRPEARPDAARAQDLRMRPHVLAVFAASLEKESPAWQLSPAAAQALREFTREARDFASLDDRRVRVRTGLARAPVHAAIDIDRDLRQAGEDAKELASSAGDVLARWTALRELLDAKQRDAMEGLYSAALLGAGGPPPGEGRASPR